MKDNAPVKPRESATGEASPSVPQGHLEAIVLDFYQHEKVIRERRKLEDCTEQSEGDWAIGDAGVPPCFWDPTQEQCANCQIRLDSTCRYRKALRGRQSAKRRMLKWAERLEVDGEMTSEASPNADPEGSQ